MCGCQNEEKRCPYQDSRHTLIIYMGGDNNLSAETSDKLNAIQAFAQNSSKVRSGEINILIYQDSKEQPKLYKGHYGTQEAELLTTYSQENSASPEVFQRVLQDCVRYAPANNYGLIVFSHASGWLPEGTLNNPSGNVNSRSLITDGASEMDIKDFANAIPDGMFEYIVFEACFMAGVEVAYELKDKTEYMVGSAAEMLSPGFTDIYPEILAGLCDTSASTEHKLINLAKTYFSHYDSQNGQTRSATISVIRTDKLDRLAQAVKTTISYQNANTQSVQHFDRNTYHLFFDLGDYLEQAKDSSAEEIRLLIREAVVYQQATPTFMPLYGGFTINKHSGLTTYIEQKEFPYLNRKYKELKWAKTLY